MDDRVAVSATKGGAGLRLRVKPGARRSRLCGPHGGALKLEVAAPPERGRANAAVVGLIAESLGVPRACVRLTAGAGSQDKAVELLGVSPEKAVSALARAGIAARAEEESPGGG